MRLQVKGKNLEISDSIRSYAEQKLRKLDKQLERPRPGRARADRREEPVDPRQPGGRGDGLHEGASAARRAPRRRDMRASIDGLTDKLLREVKEYREKRRNEPRRRAEHNGAVIFRREPLHKRLAREGGPRSRASERHARAVGQGRHPRRPPAARVGRGRRRRGRARGRAAREFVVLDDDDRDRGRPGRRRAARRRALARAAVPRRGGSPRRRASGRSPARRIEVVALPGVDGQRAGAEPPRRRAVRSSSTASAASARSLRWSGTATTRSGPGGWTGDLWEIEASLL